MDHVARAELVGRYDDQQPPRLLRWALTTPIDRVMPGQD